MPTLRFRVARYKISSILVMLMPIFLGVSIAKCSDFSSFKDKADSLTKSTSLNIFKTTETTSDQKKNSIYFELNIAGNIYNFRTETTVVLNAEARGRSEVSSYLAERQELVLGSTPLIEREYRKRTEPETESMVELMNSYRDALKKNNRPLVESLFKNIKSIRDLQFEKKIYSDDVITEMILDPIMNDSSIYSRFLKFENKTIEGTNPNLHTSSFPFISGIEGEWRDLQVIKSSNIFYLRKLGLLENQPIRYARFSVNGIPLDGSLASLETDVNGLVPLRIGSIIPGWEGGPKQVEIGKTRLIFDFVPGSSKGDPKKSPFSPLLEKSSKYLQIAPSNDKKNNTAMYLFPNSFNERTQFPMASMDLDGNVFIAFWLKMPLNLGIIYIVQYYNESKPRILFESNTGIVIRIKDRMVETGMPLKVKVTTKFIEKYLIWNGIDYWIDKKENINKITPNVKEEFEIISSRELRSTTLTIPHGKDTKKYEYLFPGSIN